MQKTTKYYLDDQINIEMGEACDSHEVRLEMHTAFWWEM
jgi:hypothetical protein